MEPLSNNVRFSRTWSSRGSVQACPTCLISVLFPHLRVYLQPLSSHLPRSQDGGKECFSFSLGWRTSMLIMIYFQTSIAGLEWDRQSENVSSSWSLATQHSQPRPPLRDPGPGEPQQQRAREKMQGSWRKKKNRTYFSVSAVSVLDKCQVCAWEFLSFPVLLHGVREARASPPFAPLPSIFSWACGRCSLWVVSIRMDWMGSIRTVVKTRKLLWAV